MHIKKQGNYHYKLIKSIIKSNFKKSNQHMQVSHYNQKNPEEIKSLHGNTDRKLLKLKPGVWLVYIYNLFSFLEREAYWFLHVVFHRSNKWYASLYITKATIPNLRNGLWKLINNFQSLVWFLNLYIIIYF